jgi:hypothetical protein
VPVSRGLAHTALLGLAAFVLYAIFGVIVLRTDWPLATLGRAAQSLWNQVTRGRRPVTGLDQRLLAERDTIRAALGRNWRQAAILTAGRRPRRLRRAGHPGLPDRLVLTPPAGRPAGLPAVPPLRAPGPPARRVTGRRPAAGTVADAPARPSDA